MQEYADIQTQQREAKAKADVEKVFDVVEIRVQVWHLPRLYMTFFSCTAWCVELWLALFLCRQGGHRPAWLFWSKCMCPAALQ